MPERQPLSIPFDQADYQAALHGFAAALCALHERRSSGRGQGIDISTAQVMGYCVGGMHLVGAKSGAKWGQRSTSMKGSLYPTGFFACKDGFVCIASQTPKQWEAFLSLMDNPKWAKEGQASNAVYLGLVDAKPADKHFRSWLMQYTRSELLDMGMAENIVMGVAQTVDEVLASEQLAFRDSWAELRLGDERPRVPKPGYVMARMPIAFAERGPALGADGERLRAETPAPIRLTEGKRREHALDGVRVLDFGWNWAGPMAGQILADMGAEVIRVETSKRQDLMRFLDYTSFFFCHNNRSKMSATFNLGKPEGSQLVRRLARKADIVMDNFAAGVMAKNGLAYEDLRKENPGIIAVSMSMAGQEGPAARHARLRLDRHGLRGARADGGLSGGRHVDGAASLRDRRHEHGDPGRRGRAGGAPPPGADRRGAVRRREPDRLLRGDAGGAAARFPALGPRGRAAGKPARALLPARALRRLGRGAVARARACATSASGGRCAG